MKPSILRYLRHSDDTTLINIVLDLAIKHEDLFVELACEHGLSEMYEFNFPHGKEQLSARTLLEIKRWCAEGNKIRGIKAYRQAMSSGLREAKEAVEYLIETDVTPLKSSRYQDW